MIGDQLQRAIYSTLKAAAICEGRIYDRPPADAVTPYVTIGDEQAQEQGSDCGQIWEVYTDVHVWDTPMGASKAMAKTIGAAIVPLLATRSLSVAAHAVQAASVSASRTFRDPDGVTEHAVITLRYILTPA